MTKTTRESVYVFEWQEGSPCPECGAKMVVNSEEYSLWERC